MEPTRAPHCKICNSFTRPLNDGKTGKLYHVCDECEFIFLDTRFILPPREEKRRYELHQNTFDNAGYVAMFEHFINDVITPHCAAPRTALDFGCGVTPVLATLLKKGIKCVDHFDPFFFPDESFKKKRYDIITMTEVMEHLKDPCSIGRMLVSLLTEGGSLAIMTKFHPCNDEQFLRWWYRLDDTHISFYTVRTMTMWGERAGLKLHWTDDDHYVLYRKERTA